MNFQGDLMNWIVFNFLKVKRQGAYNTKHYDSIASTFLQLASNSKSLGKQKKKPQGNSHFHNRLDTTCVKKLFPTPPSQLVATSLQNASSYYSAFLPLLARATAFTERLPNWWRKAVGRSPLPPLENYPQDPDPYRAFANFKSKCWGNH